MASNFQLFPIIFGLLVFEPVDNCYDSAAAAAFLGYHLLRFKQVQNSFDLAVINAVFFRDADAAGDKLTGKQKELLTPERN
jgi:hypothetical protein